VTTAGEVREALLRTYSHDALGDAGDERLELVASPYEIGRQALDSGLSLIELIASHREAERQSALLRDDALMELVAPFEMAVLGYRETIDRLRRINQDLAVVNRAIAHDLRNPVATIAMWASVARERLAGQSHGVNEVLDHISTVADHAMKLIGDLLTYSAIEESHTSPEHVDLGSVLHDVITSLAAAIRDTDAIVDWGTLPVVGGNRTHLAHVFQNLIANSIKYRSEEAPRIHLSAQRDGGGWTISCRDNGRGIPEDQWHQVFEPFWRGAGTSTSGSGLGLAICRRIVIQSGGRIWVDASGAGGTTMALTLRGGEGGQAPHRPSGHRDGGAAGPGSG
jgi:signal transduction histidine kinase